jgi:hypothetical protein
MTFYAKPINRPLALEGWFEKPRKRLFGHVRVKDQYKNRERIRTYMTLSYRHDVIVQT